MSESLRYIEGLERSIVLLESESRRVRDGVRRLCDEAEREALGAADYFLAPLVEVADLRELLGDQP